MLSLRAWQLVQPVQKLYFEAAEELAERPVCVHVVITSSDFILNLKNLGNYLRGTQLFLLSL